MPGYRGQCFLIGEGFEIFRKIYFHGRGFLIFLRGRQAFVNKSKLNHGIFARVRKLAPAFSQRPDSVSPGDPFASVAAEREFGRREYLVGV